MGSIRDENVKVFQDLKRIINEDKSVQSAIASSIENQVFIAETDDVKVNIPTEGRPCFISVTRNKSMDAASNYADGKKRIAVLNFASATTPGGGVTKGSSAQEECLCRVSTLYDCISNADMFEKFYKPHRDNLNALHNDDIIYTPNVLVLKNDDYITYDPSDRYYVDIITCAAPNLRDYNVDMFNIDKPIEREVSDEELRKIHEQRARRILSVAVSKGVNVLILGAFGCGVFRNSPTVVAEAYKNVLKDFRKAFDTVEFAVYCTAKDSTNYNAFKQVFSA